LMGGQENQVSFCTNISAFYQKYSYQTSTGASFFGCHAWGEEIGGPKSALHEVVHLWVKCQQKQGQ
jgi:hypothetical protein